MDKTEFLKQLINETGLNMKTFAERANIPYTTLRSMLERGIENASVNNVIKVCKQLDICVETLYDMCKPDMNVSSEEKQLLENYNKLNSKGKEKLLEYSDDLTTNIKYIDNASDEISTTKDDTEEYTLAAHDDGLDEETKKRNLEKAKAMFKQMDEE